MTSEERSIRQALRRAEKIKAILAREGDRMNLATLVSSLAGKPTADEIDPAKWDECQCHFTDALSNPQTEHVKAILARYASIEAS